MSGGVACLMKKTTSSVNSQSSPGAQRTPSHQEITARAEALWRGKGCPSGCDDEIWLEAERQLSHQRPLELNKAEVIGLADRRFKFNPAGDDITRELEERFPGPTGQETTSL